MRCHLSNRYANWALDDDVDSSSLLEELTSRKPSTAPQPQINIMAPPANPQPLITHQGQHQSTGPIVAPMGGPWGPPAAPVMVQVPSFRYHQRPLQTIDPIPNPCCVVKSDAHGDPYERLMAGVPDLAKQQGLDLSNGVDAMQMAGRPDGAEMRNWTPNSRYYNGVSDNSANGNLNGHTQGRHGAPLDQIRSNNGMTVRR